jgi:hypothetical protein
LLALKQAVVDKDGDALNREADHSNRAAARNRDAARASGLPDCAFGA